MTDVTKAMKDLVTIYGYSAVGLLAVKGVSTVSSVLLSPFIIIPAAGAAAYSLKYSKFGASTMAKAVVGGGVFFILLTLSPLLKIVSLVAPYLIIGNALYQTRAKLGGAIQDWWSPPTKEVSIQTDMEPSYLMMARAMPAGVRPALDSQMEMDVAKDEKTKLTPRAAAIIKNKGMVDTQEQEETAERSCLSGFVSLR